MAAELRALTEKLAQLCPVAPPDVLPLPNSSLTMLSTLLGRDADDADAINRLFDEATSSEGGGGGLVLRWGVDSEHMRFVLERCWAAPSALTDLLDTRRTLARLASRDVDEADADEAAVKLARANKVKLSSTVEKRVWMQECYSVAYAIKVIANNLGKWTFAAAPLDPSNPNERNAKRVEALLGAGAGKAVSRGSTPQATGSTKKRERAPLTTDAKTDASRSTEVGGSAKKRVHALSSVSAKVDALSSTPRRRKPQAQGL